MLLVADNTDSIFLDKCYCTTILLMNSGTIDSVHNSGNSSIFQIQLIRLGSQNVMHFPLFGSAAGLAQAV
jgi:hypothetical protein